MSKIEVAGAKGSYRAVRRLLIRGRRLRVALRLFLTLETRLPGKLRDRARGVVKRALALSDTFDASWYLSNHPDVAASGIDPALHYAYVGWREGRTPSPSFRVEVPQVLAHLDVNPLSLSAFFPYSVQSLSSVPSEAGDQMLIPASLAIDAPERLPVDHVQADTAPPQDDFGADVAGSTQQLQDPCILIVVDPPSEVAMRCARKLMSSLEDTFCLVAYFDAASNRFVIRDGRANEPGAVSFDWPGEALFAIEHIKRFQPESTEIVYGEGAGLDLELLLDCLGGDFSLTLIDASLVADRKEFWKKTPRRPKRFAARAEVIRSFSLVVIEQVHRIAPDLIISFENGMSGDDQAPLPGPFPLERDEHLQVLFWGDATPFNGRDQLVQLGRLISSKALPIVVYVLGEAAPPLLPEEQGHGALIITGAYERSHLPDVIKAIRPHILWAPWREEAWYEPLVDEIMNCPVQIFAADIPLLSKRLSERPDIKFFAAETKASEWVEHFLHFRNNLGVKAAPAATIRGSKRAVGAV